MATILIVAAAGYFVLEQVGQDKAKAAAAASPTSGPTVPVTVALAENKDVPIMIRGLGTVQAFKTVAVKARVDGQIVKISFNEGQEVKAGDPLFQIDPRPFQAALEQAKAAKQRDEAQLSGAQLDLDRYGKLIGSGFQSRQSYDQQKTTVDSLKASITADQAAIDNAELNLTYADIRAPISGRTGQRMVDLGNLIQAGQSTTLVIINQIKPIYVNFTIPQYANHHLRKRQSNTPLPVFAYSADDKMKLAEGQISLIDNQIDTATGTLRLKGEFANTDESLWPGEFVNVRLEVGMHKDAVTVPQRAVMQGANGYYAFVIKPDNTAEHRAIEVEMNQDGMSVIAKGINVGEKVVVDGQYRLTNGSRVRIDQPTAAAPAADKAG
ncbi:efflux RND transporter periplasmic adaptor subunit [Enhydrobacter aerosaccus]|uniref:efflux RND transporter periplasmic adaptor subunit n=1 Tax=Enhydrobacter aerosaccus TaxID=225324 RepID=UPI001481F80C|nr:efflux RND transporter periplasmic adaptor subunit [Enhydrobacter aerosaccus]